MQAVSTHHDNRALAAEAAAVLVAAVDTGVWPGVRDGFADVLGQPAAGLDSWAAGLRQAPPHDAARVRYEAQQLRFAELDALLAHSPAVRPGLEQVTARWRSLLTVPPPPPAMPSAAPVNGPRPRSSRRVAAFVAAVVVVAGGTGALVWTLRGSDGGSSSDGGTPSGGAANEEAANDASSGGSWTGSYHNVVPAPLDGVFRLVLTQDGTTVSGDVTLENVPSCDISGHVTGTLQDGRLSLHRTAGMTSVTVEGRMTPSGTARGTYRTTCANASGTWTATKAG